MTNLTAFIILLILTGILIFSIWLATVDMFEKKLSVKEQFYRMIIAVSLASIIAIFIYNNLIL